MGIVILLATMLCAPSRPTAVAQELGPTAVPSPPRAPRRSPPGPELTNGTFLIASRDLTDPNFSESVILLIVYSSSGALGVVINRRSDVKLAKVLPDIDELQKRPDTLYIGGPVARDQIVLLIRSAKPPDDALGVLGDLYASTSLTVLRGALKRETPAARLHAYAGYAGWGPGQLDAEVARGDWHVASADSDAVFDQAPAELWRKLIRRVEGQWVRGPRPHFFRFSYVPMSSAFARTWPSMTFSSAAFVGTPKSPNVVSSAYSLWK